MRSNILALDLGTTTGWALRLADDSLNHGFVHFKPQRFEGGGMRYLRFKRWLSELRLLAGEIHGVYFEEVRRHLGVDAAHVYGGLLATLTAWCEQKSFPYEGVPVGTIKRHATGKGNADKAAVDKVDTHDFHATILHLLGMNHEKLTYLHNGRRYRLTDVKGNVVHEILA